MGSIFEPRIWLVTLYRPNLLTEHYAVVGDMEMIKNFLRSGKFQNGKELVEILDRRKAEYQHNPFNTLSSANSEEEITISPILEIFPHYEIAHTEGKGDYTLVPADHRYEPCRRARPKAEENTNPELDKTAIWSLRDSVNGNPVTNMVVGNLDTLRDFLKKGYKSDQILEELEIKSATIGSRNSEMFLTSQGGERTIHISKASTVFPRNVAVFVPDPKTVPTPANPSKEDSVIEIFSEVSKAIEKLSSNDKKRVLGALEALYL